VATFGLDASTLGVTRLQYFVNPGNGKYSRETLLKEELLPDMRDISEYVKCRIVFSRLQNTNMRDATFLDTKLPKFRRTKSPAIHVGEVALLI